MVDGTNVMVKKQGLTKEKLEGFLPKGNRREVSEEIMAKIAQFESEGIDADYGEEMVLSHLGVLKEVKVSIAEYVDAIKFCSLVMSGTSAHKAWEIVFPEKAQEIRDRNDGKLSTSWSSMYNKSKIVTKLMAAMYVPAHIVYQPLNAWAIQKQYKLARGIGANPNDRVSAHVQMLAAKELYDMTKMPTDNKIQLEIGMDKESKSLQQQLFDQLAKSTAMQMERLAKGESISDVQRLDIGYKSGDIVDCELEEDE